LRLFSIVNSSRLQNDVAVTRSCRIATNTLQFRWELFNLINRVNSTR
jgi:hypothetical protein